MVLNNTSIVIVDWRYIVKHIVNRILEKDEIWVIKLLLFQSGILVILGLIYIGRYLS
jgi:hypothetical protein